MVKKTNKQTNKKRSYFFLICMFGFFNFIFLTNCAFIISSYWFTSASQSDHYIRYVCVSVCMSVCLSRAQLCGIWSDLDETSIWCWYQCLVLSLWRWAPMPIVGRATPICNFCFFHIFSRFFLSKFPVEKLCALAICTTYKKFSLIRSILREKIGFEEMGGDR